MAEKIFIRTGGWYKANQKRLRSDLEITALIADAAAEYPEATSSGGTATLQGTLTSYQNSAMSAPVQAYVFKDANDNIVRVYEPLRNNDVSRNQFTYADSIDKFPFDSVNCFGNILNDVKIVLVASDIVMKGNSLETMVIKFNSHTGLVINNNKWKGNYGLQIISGAEWEFSGNNSLLYNNTAITGGKTGEQPASNLIGIGAGNKIAYNIFTEGGYINFAGFTFNIDGFVYNEVRGAGITLQNNFTGIINSVFFPNSAVSLNNTLGYITGCTFLQDCNIIIGAGGDLDSCYFGNKKQTSILNSYTGETWSGNISTFSGNINLNDTTVFLDGNVSVPSHYGKINLTSVNPTATINSIGTPLSNDYTERKFTSSTSALTFNLTTINGNPTNLHFPSGETSEVITANGNDFVKFSRSTNNGQYYLINKTLY